MDQTYSFSDEIVLRVPSLAIKSEKINQIRDIERVFENKLFYEALYLASPLLLQEFQRIKSKNVLHEDGSKKIVHSLLKYYQRMSHRCTPFGLFSGCSVGEWFSENSVLKKNVLHRCTRLDMHYSVGLSNYFSTSRVIRNNLKFFPNTSLYKSFDKLRYTEFFYQTKSRKHQLSEIDNSIYLTKLLNAAQTGLNITELIRSIEDDDINTEMAKTFIEELIANQILVCELDPTVSGQEILDALINTLEQVNSKSEHEEIKATLSNLNQIKINLKNLDDKKINEISEYQKTIELIKYFPPEIDESKIFQVDTFPVVYHAKKDVPFSLSTDIRKKILKVLPILTKLTDFEPNSNLVSFREEFIKRYEGNMIPLLQVMDNELGIGYGNNFKSDTERDGILEEIYLANQKRDDSIKWSPIQNFLFQKLIAATKENLYEVEFNLKDVEQLPENKIQFPDSWSVMFSIISCGENKSEINLKGFWGPSATTLLGRFAAGSVEIKNLVEKICEQEEALNPGKIIAEVVHLPESRVGNILLRPTIRKNEITYLAGRNRECESQINLQDLYVKVVNNKIILWSETLQKEVLPRMANAHNYRANPLPVYHFLCDLQSQDIVPGISFSWGSMQHQFKFLPRTIVNTIIVSPATWQFSKEDYSFIVQSEFQEQKKKLFDWKEKWKIPDRFYIADGDNELVIHLTESNELLTELFIEELRSRKQLVLKEFLFDLENPLVKDEFGDGYTNEIVAPMLLTSKQNQVIKKLVKSTSTKQYVPGSEWVYFKFYSGTKTAERILVELISPLVQELHKQRLIDKWFFIRYGDPDAHLRVRFHSDQPDNVAKLISVVHQKFRESVFYEWNLNLQIDTYKPELDRYGDVNISSTENLFFHDSEAFLNFLNVEASYGIKNQRWKYALLVLDQFLNDFSLSEENKIKFLEMLSKNFRNEFKLEGKNKIPMDKKYRKLEPEIAKVFDLNNSDPSLKEVRMLLQQRTDKFKPVIQDIKEHFEINFSNVSTDEYLASCIHMMMNRIFTNNQRLAETFVYDFYYRYLKSNNLRRTKSMNLHLEEKIKPLV